LADYSKYKYYKGERKNPFSDFIDNNTSNDDLYFKWLSKYLWKIEYWFIENDNNELKNRYFSKLGIKRDRKYLNERIVVVPVDNKHYKLQHSFIIAKMKCLFFLELY
jgi:hypothetical protein